MNAFAKFLNSKSGRLLPRSEWAKRFDVTPSFVAHMVSGVRLPGLATAYRIELHTLGQVTMQSWIGPPLGGSLPDVDAELAAAS
jgi:hypothetical protein